MTEASILRSEFEEFKESILKKIDELEARLPKVEKTAKLEAEETAKPKTTKKSQKDIVVEENTRMMFSGNSPRNES